MQLKPHASGYISGKGITLTTCTGKSTYQIIVHWRLRIENASVSWDRRDNCPKPQPIQPKHGSFRQSFIRRNAFSFHLLLLYFYSHFQFYDVSMRRPKRLNWARSQTPPSAQEKATWRLYKASRIGTSKRTPKARMKSLF